jgi:ubiquinone/menaquinone biosynthesis C-methylase UbiE
MWGQPPRLSGRAKLDSRLRCNSKSQPSIRYLILTIEEIASATLVLMQRINTPEILDSADCPPREIEASLRDLSRINRWFGGVATTRKLIERVAAATGRKHFSVLEVAAGHGEVPKVAAQQLARKGITLDVTHLDRASSHLLRGNRAVVADALALPFPDSSFDLVSCSLFAHHLEPEELARFAREASRVSRLAVLINDLVRHPLHLALVYAGFPLMRSYVSRVDGVASVRRAYVPEEMREIFSDRGSVPGTIELSLHYLFRMGVIVWKPAGTSTVPAVP